MVIFLQLEGLNQLRFGLYLALNFSAIALTSVWLIYRPADKSQTLRPSIGLANIALKLPLLCNLKKI